MRAALLAVVLAAGGCSASRPAPAPSTPATSVAMFRETRAAAIPTALRQAATGARLLGACGFAWGVVAQPRDARGTRLILGAAAIDGWLLCGESLRALTADRRLRRVDVRWSDGRLLSSTAGASRAVSLEELARALDTARTFVRFSLAPRDKITARALQPTLARLARAVRFVVWELP